MYSFSTLNSLAKRLQKGLYKERFLRIRFIAILYSLYFTSITKFFIEKTFLYFKKYFKRLLSRTAIASFNFLISKIKLYVLKLAKANINLLKLFKLILVYSAFLLKNIRVDYIKLRIKFYVFNYSMLSTRLKPLISFISKVFLLIYF